METVIFKANDFKNNIAVLKAEVLYHTRYCNGEECADIVTGRIFFNDVYYRHNYEVRRIFRVRHHENIEPYLQLTEEQYKARFDQAEEMNFLYA